jgi:hypothetical protein
MTRLRLGAEQTLLEATDLGLESGEAGMEVGFTLLGGLEQGAVIARLLPSLQELGTIRASRAAKPRERAKEVGAMAARRCSSRRGQGHRRSKGRRQLG